MRKHEVGKVRKIAVTLHHCYNSWVICFRDVSRSSLRLCKLAVIKHLVSLFWKCVDYSGQFAFIVKAIPVIIMLVIIAYPWWSYPLWLSLSMTLKEPYSYIIYVVWLSQWVLVGLFALAVEYVRES